MAPSHHVYRWHILQLVKLSLWGKLCISAPSWALPVHTVQCLILDEGPPPRCHSSVSSLESEDYNLEQVFVPMLVFRVS